MARRNSRNDHVVDDHNQLGNRWTDTNYEEATGDDEETCPSSGGGSSKRLGLAASITASVTASIKSKVGRSGRMKEGEGFDVIFVEGNDGELYENSDFLVSFKGEKDNGGYIANDDPNKVVVMEIVQEEGAADGEKLWFQIRKGGSIPPEKYDDEKESSLSTMKEILKPGRNPIRYLLLDQEHKVIVGVAHVSIYLWNYQDSIIVSDIDGTVTKSNVKGLLGTVATKQYSRVSHDGICHLLTNMSEQPSPISDAGKSHVVFLTSRPTLLAKETRQLLVELEQEHAGTMIGLPSGPLLGFGGKVGKVIKMELVTHSANEFKSKKLWQQIVEPFKDASPSKHDPPTFIAGLGNNTRDMQAYHSIGMDLHRIFMIDKKSIIVTFDKKLKELDGGDDHYDADDDDDDDDDENKNDDDDDNNDDSSRNDDKKKKSHTITGAAAEKNYHNPLDANFTFHSDKFYKERIGTEFHGYSDTKLHERFGF